MRYDMPEGGLLPPPGFRGRIRSAIKEYYVTKPLADGWCLFVAWAKYDGLTRSTRTARYKL